MAIAWGTAGLRTSNTLLSDFEYLVAALYADETEPPYFTAKRIWPTRMPSRPPLSSMVSRKSGIGSFRTGD